MIYEKDGSIVITIPGYDKQDIPLFINALLDLVKFSDEDSYEMLKHTNAFYYAAVIIDSFLPSVEQFKSIDLSEH